MKKNLMIALSVAAVSISSTATAGVEEDYMAVCNSCHNIAIAPALQAPGVGDKAAWAPRIAKGMDALYNTALKGSTVNPVMMPKGGATHLSDDAVKALVDYMVDKSK
jgi:cytochrome c5